MFKEQSDRSQNKACEYVSFVISVVGLFCDIEMYACKKKSQKEPTKETLNKRHTQETFQYEKRLTKETHGRDFTISKKQKNVKKNPQKRL